MYVLGKVRVAGWLIEWLNLVTKDIWRVGDERFVYCASVIRLVRISRLTEWLVISVLTETGLVLGCARWSC